MLQQVAFADALHGLRIRRIDQGAVLVKERAQAVCAFVRCRDVRAEQYGKHLVEVSHVVEGAQLA